MDLRIYYQNIRKIEAELKEPEVVIVSRETPDGGKRGMKSDVPRGVAARLIADERADLASPEGATQFRAEVESKWKAANGTPAAAAVGLTAPRNSTKPARNK